MKKKNRKILLIILSILALAIIMGAYVYLRPTQKLLDVTAGDCLSQSQSAICKASCPTDYHQISGDCSSISSNFICCDIGSGGGGGGGSSAPDDFEQITDTEKATNFNLNSYPNAKCCIRYGYFSYLDFFGDCPVEDTSMSPTKFNEHICMGDQYTQSNYACQGGGYYCDDAFWRYYYCDLAVGSGGVSGFVKCDEGCNQQTGLCNEGLKDCTTGQMACCNDADDCKSEIYRPSGSLFECVNSKWTLKSTCNAGCTEASQNSAYTCNFQKYYCISGCSESFYGNANVLNPQWTDKSSDCYGTCYATPEQCLANAPTVRANLKKSCYKFTDSRGVIGYRWVDKCMVGSYYRNDFVNQQVENTTMENLNESDCRELDECSYNSIDPKCTDIFSTDSLTWTKYYTISDEDFVNGHYYCKNDKNCAPLDGYAISCNNQTELKKRSYNYFKSKCSDWGAIGNSFDWIISHVSFGTLTPKETICGTYASFENFLTNGWGKTGVCMADSKSWYGKIWDYFIKMFGKMGVTGQLLIFLMWFLIIVFSIIVLIIAIIIIMMFKKLIKKRRR